MRLRVLIACATLPVALWLVLPLFSNAASERQVVQLQKKIDVARNKIGKKKGAEKTLSVDIYSYSKRINTLQTRIGSLADRQAILQRDLDAKRAELLRIQTALREERARLTRLRARLRVARRALAVRMVETYKASKPDVVSVVLNSGDFADLWERADFIKRIADQDGKIVTLVRAARVDAVATTKKLDRLEGRQQRVTSAVLHRREEIRLIKDQLVGTRVGYSRTKAGKQAALQKVREDKHALQEDVEAMEKEQAAIEEKLRVAAGGIGAGPIVHGSGRLIWPVRGPVTGAFGEQRPGHLHAGLDIAAPDGTPIRAADGGKVVLLGWTGGYGNYTCIQHTSSMSTCYAHQSRYGTSMGASVRQGQVIGYVGNTGHSFGAHLHFEVRMNGSPTSPLSYL